MGASLTSTARVPVTIQEAGKYLVFVFLYEFTDFIVFVKLCNLCSFAAIIDEDVLRYKEVKKKGTDYMLIKIVICNIYTTVITREFFTRKRISDNLLFNRLCSFNNKYGRSKFGTSL